MSPLGEGLGFSLFLILNETKVMITILDKINGIGFCVLLCIFSSYTLAEPIPVNDLNSIAGQQQQIQQEQQATVEKQFEKDLKPNKPAATLSMPIELPQTSIGGECREINQIAVHGVEQFNQKDFKPVLDQYLGRCLNGGDIQRLMSEVTAFYILKGFITTRVYLAEQDLNSGHLILLVVEGALEQVKVRDSLGEASDSIWVRNIFPGDLDEPLNLRDVEQAVDQINRLRSNNVTILIEPGEKTGGSVLVFENTKTKEWEIAVTHDNLGSDSTGKYQGSVNVSLDNPLGLNDFVSITHRQTLPYHSSEKGVQSQSLTYVVPFGYSVFSLNASLSKYSSPLSVPSGRTLLSEGDSNIYTARLDRVVYRDRSARWRVGAALTSKENKNFLEGALISVNSRRLTTATLDTTYSFSQFGGQFSAGMGYTFGTDWLGALEDMDDLPSSAPRAQFGKWNFNLSFVKSFEAWNQNFVYSSQLNGQYSEDVLYGTETLFVGGVYSVRGFSQNTLSGDHGYTWRNDFYMPMRFTVRNVPLSVRPYVGLDYGAVSSFNSSVPEGELAGATAGVSVSSGPVSVEMFASQALEKPNDMKDEGILFYFMVSARY